MSRHLFEDIVGRQRLHETDVAFDEGFAGQHRLHARTAIAAMEAVDRQRRVQHQPVVITALLRRVQLDQPKLRLDRIEVQREVRYCLTLEICGGGDRVYEALDRDFPRRIFHGGEKMHQLPDGVRHHAPEIAGVDVAARRPGA